MKIAQKLVRRQGAKTAKEIATDKGLKAAKDTLIKTAKKVAATDTADRTLAAKLVAEHVKKAEGRGGMAVFVNEVDLRAAKVGGEKVPGLYFFKGKATKHTLVSFPPAKWEITFKGLVDTSLQAIDEYSRKVGQAIFR